MYSSKNVTNNGRDMSGQIHMSQERHGLVEVTTAHAHTCLHSMITWWHEMLSRLLQLVVYLCIGYAMPWHEDDFF